MLSLPEPEYLTCFALGAEGATDICRGGEYASLRDPKRGADPGALSATGILASVTAPPLVT